MFLFFLSGAVSIMVPCVTFAATIETTLDMFLYVALMLIRIFGTLAFVAFFYGLALFLLNHEDKTINEKGKNVMVWGVLALFVMITIWGIIGFMQDTIGNYQGPYGVQINLPQV